MKKVGYAVIGAGYGDEGKGLITDFLARKYTSDGKAPVVVRCNGGSQAGHTVVTESNQRHVFGHIGAGTFAGSSTFLSSKFIFNPIALAKEREQLKTEFGIVPRIEVHPDCPVTTIFDMALNALSELARGQNRHGSCGQGINETVTRHLAGYPVTIEDMDDSALVDKLRHIVTNWWLPRFNGLDLTNVKDPELPQLLNIFNNFEDYIGAMRTMASIRSMFSVGMRPTRNFSRQDVYVFEGAQGLGLDEFLGVFPHVTRSITGLPSALLAAHEIGVTEINPQYVTRCYKTRHGAGPLSHEGMAFSMNPIQDLTNITGKWQGKLRFAPLDLDYLEQLIEQDLERSQELAKVLRITINAPKIAVTCVDQVGDSVGFVSNGALDAAPTDELIREIDHILPVNLVSNGPTANRVSEA